MKILNIIFVVVFILSAALQYNDPDPYVWIPIYLYAAYVCYLAIKKRYPPALYYIGLTIYVAYAIFLFFDKTGVLSWVRDHDAEPIAQSMKATKPWIEETREFGGLMIIVVAFIINMLWLRRSKTIA